MKTYRFFFHYNKQHKKISVHYKGKCYLIRNLVCNVSVESKWNEIQPNFVMQGFCSLFIVDDSTDTIKLN